MIKGFIVNTKEAADGINAAIREAASNHGIAPVWEAGYVLIHSGENAGRFLIPFGDEMMTTFLRNKKCVSDYPEFPGLVSMLGGLDARVEIPPADLINPNAPVEPIDPNAPPDESDFDPNAPE